jgi:hypothetical protein
VARSLTRGRTDPGCGRCYSRQASGYKTVYVLDRLQSRSISIYLPRGWPQAGARSHAPVSTSLPGAHDEQVAADATATERFSMLLQLIVAPCGACAVDIYGVRTAEHATGPPRRSQRPLAARSTDVRIASRKRTTLSGSALAPRHNPLSSRLHASPGTRAETLPARDGQPRCPDTPAHAAARSGKDPSVSASPLLFAQRDSRVDAAGAPGRQQRTRERDDDERRNRDSHNHRVPRAHLEQQALRHPSGGERGAESE